VIQTARRFAGIYCNHLQHQRVREGRNQQKQVVTILETALHFSETSALSELHEVTSQKTVLVIVPTSITSNLTILYYVIAEFKKILIWKLYSRDSSVGLATGWTARFRFPTGKSDLSLLHSAQTCCVDHPASYPMNTGGSFPGGKGAGS
jgi:hypothetical protein